MSWRDRPYSGEDGEPELRIQFRRPGTAVTSLIVINVAVFFLQLILRRAGVNLSETFGLSAQGLRSLYLWQLVTYMFLHADVMHLLFNMLGLYVFGSEFERTFGRRRFLEFYGICGVTGGLAYLALGLIRAYPYAYVPVVGASGAIYGLLLAAMIFWPQMQVILFLFPVPVRVLGLILLAIIALQALSGGVANLGGEVCHMAGAAGGIGVLYMWGIMPAVRIGSGRGFTLLPGSGPRRPRRPRREGAWARKQQQLAEEQAEVDRILQKVHDHGLGSLTRSERKALSRATQRQRERDRELHRVDRL